MSEEQPKTAQVPLKLELNRQDGVLRKDDVLRIGNRMLSDEDVQAHFYRFHRLEALFTREDRWILPTRATRRDSPTCALRMTYDNMTFFGTGRLILPNVVLTCAHNIFEPGVGTPREVHAIPSQCLAEGCPTATCPQAPAGAFGALKGDDAYAWHPNYAGKPRDMWDIALVRVEPVLTSPWQRRFREDDALGKCVSWQKYTPEPTVLAGDHYPAGYAGVGRRYSHESYTIARIRDGLWYSEELFVSAGSSGAAMECLDPERTGIIGVVTGGYGVRGAAPGFGVLFQPEHLEWMTETLLRWGLHLRR